MHFEDLGQRTPIESGPHIRAVGWLSETDPFPTGNVPQHFIERLGAICERWSESVAALDWPVAPGLHECEFCRGYWASGNLGVPAGAVLYVVPQMIGHYVRSHGYRPPAAFVEATLSCPLPGTKEYACAVRMFV